MADRVLYLHFQIIMRVGVVSNSDIQTNTVAVRINIKSLFCFKIGDICNFGVEKFFQNMLADALSEHDVLEKKIVGKS